MPVLIAVPIVLICLKKQTQHNKRVIATDNNVNSTNTTTLANEDMSHIAEAITEAAKPRVSIFLSNMETIGEVGAARVETFHRNVDTIRSSILHPGEGSLVIKDLSISGRSSRSRSDSYSL